MAPEGSVYRVLRVTFRVQGLGFPVEYQLGMHTESSRARVTGQQGADAWRPRVSVHGRAACARPTCAWARCGQKPLCSFTKSIRSMVAGGSCGVAHPSRRPSCVRGAPVCQPRRAGEATGAPRFLAENILALGPEAPPRTTCDAGDPRAQVSSLFWLMAKYTSEERVWHHPPSAGSGECKRKRPGSWTFSSPVVVLHVPKQPLYTGTPTGLSAVLHELADALPGCKHASWQGKRRYEIKGGAACAQEHLDATFRRLAAAIACCRQSTG